MMSVGSDEPASGRPWFHSLLAGLFLALVALGTAPLLGLDVRWTLTHEGGGITATALFFGVFIAGWLVWALLPARPGGNSVRRGGVAGVVAACLSYPIVLLLAEFLQADWQTGSDATTILGRIVQVLVLAFMALLTTGFAAALLLGLAGILAGWVEGRAAPRRSGAPPRRLSIAGRIIRIFSYLVVGIVVLLMFSFFALSLLPVRAIAVATAPAPATTHDEALAAFARIEDAEAQLDLNPRCRTSLLTHGSKVDRVVIFYHGLTNCPAQAEELAPMLFDLGYNVLVPRLPGHGEADPMTMALADVTAEDFLDTARTATALAHGLGDDVVVLGLSAGGTIAAYQGQYDGALASAVPSAPFLAPAGMPGWSVRAATNLMLLLPNLMLWWDPSAPYASPPMDYAYPRFATHALAEVMRMGVIVSAEAAVGSALAPHLGMLLNENDTSISNPVALDLVANWRAHGSPVDYRYLPKSLGLPHDIVDPRQADADTAVVYPVLADMVSADAAGQ